MNTRDKVTAIAIMITVTDQGNGITCRLHPESRARIALVMPLGIPNSIFLEGLKPEYLVGMSVDDTEVRDDLLRLQAHVVAMLIGMSDRELAPFGGYRFCEA